MWSNRYVCRCGLPFNEHFVVFFVEIPNDRKLQCAFVQGAAVSLVKSLTDSSKEISICHKLLSFEPATAQ
jgi:hypothetical protein